MFLDKVDFKKGSMFVRGTIKIHAYEMNHVLDGKKGKNKVKFKIGQDSLFFVKELFVMSKSNQF